MQKSLIAISIFTSLALAETYNLGQVNVQAKALDDINMIEQSVNSSTITQNNELTIAESLDNVSGISLDYSGGRSEAKVSIRGYDSKRVGVFIDGIPIYNPYDGNFDFGRYLTNDVSQIDISKGYSSVVYGANTMGGAINIVSKKPTKELEGNIRGEIILDSDGQMARHIESFNVGSRVDNFYAQLSGTLSKRDYFRLSDDYTPVSNSTQPKGERLHSYAKDQFINLKGGYIADDKSEIAINYLNQKGNKQHPVSVDKTLSKELFRDSPKWDKEMISLSGLKNFNNGYIKALAYYQKNENVTDEYKTSAYKILKVSTNNDDYSYGGRLEYGLETKNNLLKLVANYKKDVHKAYETKPATPTANTEHFEEHTISLGVEDSYYITKDLEILAGISYDRLSADKVYYPGGYEGLDTISAFNPQAALIYTLNPESKVKVSASQKTHLPTMKERYSGGSSTKAANPDLDKEVANHYELAYTYKTKKLFLSTSLYYSEVKDAIEAMVYAPDPSLKQNQNVGDFEHVGAEFDVTYKNDSTKVGANYAFVEVKNKRDSSVKAKGIPKNQLFAYIEQKLGAGFSFYVNTKFRDGVYNQITDGSYEKIGSFTTFDTKLIYDYMESLKFEVGVKNLTDKLIQYNLGYPEAGREYFATLNYKF